MQILGQHSLRREGGRWGTLRYYRLLKILVSKTNMQTDRKIDNEVVLYRFGSCLLRYGTPKNEQKLTKVTLYVTYPTFN